MKTLTLLRHAKSGWDDPVTRDFDRPLNAKGKRAAQTVGRNLRDLGLEFDHIVASPAIRVGETLDAVVAGYGRKLAPVWERRIYLASAATLLDVVHELPADADRVLLVGHNPGLEDLVLMLVPEAADGLRTLVEEKYPTATMAEMTLAITGWDDAAAGRATLTRYIRPRDLDATLGPDED
ncbi:histidine phosphatase family protein [Sphingomonadaceae bacterium OTU29MARTA1]|uniref:SixA phosphatase family protein n=1 Tax=Sphingomonas sp. Leaf37 TaxID=2876552 RepID=UPI001E5F7D4C|nr:histidine phosphatase family protein [Sphingomonas sp. Leaf37]USU03697.1 histidine phosphatase family protein [Sphingomonadaceae bacterium OTU29LAMAA1]USU07448.1 histidine phosphatase family protein [Sphingomonadaceae bacterium OTU29MARTA1]USU10941.1 histidine phosphatase family protein [Sphingomonadaceae bacterium OTU29THOMA1]